MQCIRTDPEHHARRGQVAASLGVSIPPVVNEFCNACGQWHMMQTGDQGDPRFGLPPVDAPPKKDKPDAWFPRSYCQVCHAYHNSDGRCAGPREVQEWASKEMM